MYISPYITARDSVCLSSKNTGLGNVLFQIATAYGLARRHGSEVSRENIEQYANILQERFGYNHKYTILRNCFSRFPNIHCQATLTETPGSNRCIDTNILNAVVSHSQSSQSCILCGYFECRQYFEEYANEIRDLFEPDDSSIHLLKQLLPILFTDANTVSIHFRLETHDMKKLFNLEYYKSAVEFIKKNIVNPVFIIFTDNRPETDPTLVGIDNYIFSDTPYDYLDLWGISFCRHNITSCSTFSFWGSYLNKNPTKYILYEKGRQVDWYPEGVAI
jgi:hypothetical protein